MASKSTNLLTPLPNPEEQTSPSRPLYNIPSPKPSQPGPERGDSPEYLCPPVSPPLRRSERNIPSDSPTKPSAALKASPQSSQPAPPAIPPVHRNKRKHPDTDPLPLSPPRRKIKFAADSDEITTPPNSPTKHGMCLRNSPKSPALTPKSPPITPKSPPITPKSPPITPKSPPITPKSPPITPKSPAITPKSLKSETPEPFKTPRKPLLIPRISRKRVRLEFKEPDPATFTSLTELFDYDDIITRKPRIPKLPRLPRMNPTTADEISPLQHLICEEKFL